MPILQRIANLFQRDRIQREIEAELASHLAMRIEDNLAAGMDAKQARRSAQLSFGNLALTRERTTEADVALAIESLGSDIRYALRQLLKARGFSVAAILTLALAIGVNTSVFTLVHAILLRQLPFDQPERVFHLENSMSAGLGFQMNAKSVKAAFDSAARSFQTVESAAIYGSGGVNAGFGTSASRRVQATETSARLLDVLGVQPQLGRSFLPTEDLPGNDHVVLVSDSYWRSALDRDPNAIGKSLRINSFLFTIVGILPAHMDFPAKTDLWTPTIFDEHTVLREAGAFFTPVVVRRKAGASAEQLSAEFRARALSISAKTAPDDMPELTPIASELTKSIRTTLLLLSGAVGLVLLIACANIAGLMLVRAAVRRSEFAVRAALGAPRSRLMRQQLVESLLVALAGGALGVLVSYGALHALYLLRPAVLNGFDRPDIDPTVLLFTAAIAILTGLVFGLVPAWLAAHEDPISALKSGAWRGAPSTARLRKALVVTQIGLAFVLLTGAGLLLRTIANLNAVPLGYATEGILSFSVSLHGAPYYTTEHSTPALASFYSSVLDRLRALPGVDAAAAIDMPPLDYARPDMQLPVKPSQSNRSPVPAALRITGPGYFRLMGIPLLEGREFAAEDTRTSAPAVILTRDLADRLWPGENPIGKKLHCVFFCDREPTVIGVVAPIRHYGPNALTFPQYFFSFTQQDWGYMTFLIRTQGDPAALTGPVRQAVAAIDPAQPIYAIQTMRQRLNDSESLVRFELFTLSVFAALATLLAVLGLYGVISYTVAQRSRDIGIRIALGASLGAIRTGILCEAALLALAGATLGLAASLGVTRLLKASLFQVSAHDPLTLIAIFAIFCGVALLATIIPANRAASIDPIEALRNE
jgi:putative ABC transport system permease protein